MKRAFRILLIFCAMLALAGVSFAASPPNGTLSGRVYDYVSNTYAPAQSYPVAQLRLNGSAILGEVPGIVMGGRVMTPLRLLAEELGATVEWSQEQAQVVVTTENRRILLTLGSEYAQVDGKTVLLPDKVCATMLFYQGQGHTMVPLRFFAEALDCDVSWEQGSYTAVISQADFGAETLLAGLDSPVNPQQYLIALDAGHGGQYSGAYYEGTAEKDLNLSMTLKLNRVLQALGYQTLLTRSEDVDISLVARSRLANQAQADLFVSVHCNASESNTAFQGLYVYHYPASGEGSALAQKIQTAACQFTGAVDRKINQANFAVLRQTSMPAVLVETGFMSCSEELERLKDEAYQWRMARGIAQGIVQYLNTST